MKRRYLYSILFGVPGFIVALLVSFLLFGFAAGVLWLFVFGDNPWPEVVGSAFPILLALVFLILWLGSLAIGFSVGKRLESNPTLNKAHILASAGVTIVCILFILLQQVSVGNIGPKPDSTRCSDYCTQQGYSASSMPPRNSGQRTCSCLDSSGVEIITVPLESITSGR